ncbi:MAG: hypothetical protein QNL62_21530 [Gammaproteobacteria bacterium]|nr:hypothetical protein [Gammaproteobacteria bacterium]
MEKRLKYRQISIVYSTSPGLSQACRLTEADSTQPQDSAIGNVNTQRFSLDPIIDGFLTLARTMGPESTGDDNNYFDRAGSMMANSMRAPFLLSAWMISNEPIYAYINDISGAPRIQGVMHTSPGKSELLG